MKYAIMLMLVAAALLTACSRQVESSPPAPTPTRQQPSEGRTQYAAADYADNGIMCRRDEYDPEAQ